VRRGELEREREQKYLEEQRLREEERLKKKRERELEYAPVAATKPQLQPLKEDEPPKME
jgi:hypothetical protein